MGRVRRLAATLTVSLALLAAPPGGLQAGALLAPCVADCDDDGALQINELVGAVNIALGSPLAECPQADANGDGRVSIDELVNAVSDALYGCGVEPPTPPPTRTPTATPSPSATPEHTATPTVGVDVSGLWRSDMARLASSTCPRAITDAVRAAIRAGTFNCDFAIAQRGAAADVTETCGGESIMVVAEVSAAGVLTRSEQEADNADGCPFTLTTTVSTDLSVSPTSITGTYAFAFAPVCGLADCTAVISGRMRRLE